MKFKLCLSVLILSVTVSVFAGDRVGNGRSVCEGGDERGNGLLGGHGGGSDLLIRGGMDGGGGGSGGKPGKPLAGGHDGSGD